MIKYSEQPRKKKKQKTNIYIHIYFICSLMAERRIEWNVKKVVAEVEVVAMVVLVVSFHSK